MILFIHGACSSNSEWDLVTPYLQDVFHLLLPDLPHYGTSSAVAPFTVELAVSLLAEIIRTRAMNRKAHIVGLSLGAHVAAALASAHDELAGAVFISGYELYPDMSPETMARGLWLQSRINAALPRSWMRWTMDGTDIPPDVHKPTLQLCCEVAAPHTTRRGSHSALTPWRARTLIIAAGKKDWLPTADHPDDAIALRDVLHEAQDGKTKAATHPEIRHPWNRQRPELFANAVRSWIEDSILLNGFREL